MAFDGFFIRETIKEIKPNILSGRINDVTFFKGAFQFRVYKQGETNYLTYNLDPNYLGIYFSDFINSEENHFTSILKHHVNGGLIIDFSQYLSDRVIELTIEKRDFIHGKVIYKVVFEAMGRHANLIITNNDIIVDAYKKSIDKKDRNIIIGEKYQYIKDNKESFEKIDYKKVTSTKDLVDMYYGISPDLSKYLFQHKKQISDMVFLPTLAETGRFSASDIFNSGDKTYFSSLSELMNKRFIKPNQSITNELEFIVHAVENRTQKISKLKQALLLFEANLSHREVADSIYASGKDMNSYEREHCGVQLDSQLTLNENAQKLYSNYQKAKRGIINVNEQIHITFKEINDLQDLLSMLKLIDYKMIDDFRSDLRPFGFKPKVKQLKQAKQINFYLINLPNNEQLYYGANNRQNAYLVDRVGKKNDWWFHVKNYPGSHVLLRGNSEENISAAAMVAGYFSQVNLSDNILVNQTRFANVNKIPQTPSYTVSIKDETTHRVNLDYELLERLLGFKLKQK